MHQRKVTTVCAWPSSEIFEVERSFNLKVLTIWVLFFLVWFGYSVQEIGSSLKEQNIELGGGGTRL